MNMNFNVKLQRNFIHSCNERLGSCFTPWATANHFIPALGSYQMKYSATWQPIHPVPLKVRPKTMGLQSAWEERASLEQQGKIQDSFPALTLCWLEFRLSHSLQTPFHSLPNENPGSCFPGSHEHQLTWGIFLYHALVSDDITEREACEKTVHYQCSIT